MKKLNPTLHVLPVAICLAFFTSMAALAQAPANQATAQTPLGASSNPASWPKSQDAVVSGKRNHKVLLENESVRVLEVSVLPGETEALHHHQWPSVLYFMDAGDFIDRDAHGNILLDTRTLPEPLKFPLTKWKAPEAAHAVENLSKTKTIRLVRVEIKK